MTQANNPPGNLDKLKLRTLWSSTGPYEFPGLYPVPLDIVPEYLIPYGRRTRSKKITPDNTAVHFYKSDLEFETVFFRPDKAWQFLDRYNTLLAPDFTIFRGMPLPLEMFQIYRSRWCARLWQERGKYVIPNIRWTTPDRYEMAFSGLPKGNVVAVSSVNTGLSDPTDRRYFINGYQAMMEWLRPKVILFHGPLPEGISSIAEVVHYNYVHWSKEKHQQPSRRVRVEVVESGE